MTFVQKFPPQNRWEWSKLKAAIARCREEGGAIATVLCSPLTTISPREVAVSPSQGPVGESDPVEAIASRTVNFSV